MVMLMMCAVTAKYAIAAQGDIDLSHSHCDQTIGGLPGAIASGNGLCFQQVEFQGMKVLFFALLQCFNDAWRLGCAHCIYYERRDAIVNEIVESCS